MKSQLTFSFSWVKVFIVFTNSVFGRNARKPCDTNFKMYSKKSETFYTHVRKREMCNILGQTSILVSRPPVFHSVILTSIGSLSCLICTEHTHTHIDKLICTKYDTI